MTCQHKIKHTTQRVDVCPAVQPKSVGLLRAHVPIRPENGANHGSRESRIVHILGDSEIQDTDALIVANHDVAGLHVAMNEILLVDNLHRIQDFDHEPRGAFIGDGAILLHVLLHIQAIHQLHDDIEVIVQRELVIDLDDALVVQLLKHFHLSLGAGADLHILGELRPDLLDRNLTSIGSYATQHAAHATRTDGCLVNLIY